MAVNEPVWSYGKSGLFKSSGGTVAADDDIWSYGKDELWHEIAGVSYTLPAGIGSYALSGQAVNLLKNSKIQAAGGAYSLSGTAASLLKNSKLQAEIGSYILTGQAANLIYSGAAFIPKKSLLLLGVGK